MTLQQISDGLTYTILIGEKHVPVNTFGHGPFDSSVYNGDNPVSWARGAGLGIGAAEHRDNPVWQFGSYHPGFCQFVFCDGRVQTITSAINPLTLSRLCGRSDGEETNFNLFE